VIDAQTPDKWLLLTQCGAAKIIAPIINDWENEVYFDQTFEIALGFGACSTAT
jgi:hypothetical protein